MYLLARCWKGETTRWKEVGEEGGREGGRGQNRMKRRDSSEGVRGGGSTAEGGREGGEGTVGTMEKQRGGGREEEDNLGEGRGRKRHQERAGGIRREEKYQDKGGGVKREDWERKRERERERDQQGKRWGGGGGLEGESVGGRERKITRGKLSASPPAWSDICSSTQTERA